MTEPGDSEECHQIIEIGISQDANDLHGVVGVDSLGDDAGVVHRRLFDKLVQLLWRVVHVLGVFMWVGNDGLAIAILLRSQADQLIDS